MNRLFGDRISDSQSPYGIITNYHVVAEMVLNYIQCAVQTSKSGCFS